MIVSGCTAALDLDTNPLGNLIRPRCALRAKPVRDKPVLIMHMGFSLVFTSYLSNAVVSAKSPRYFSFPCSTEAVGVAHKPPRSLWCENSQTDRQTHNDYYHNPRCACAPRVNYAYLLFPLFSRHIPRFSKIATYIFIPL